MINKKQLHCVFRNYIEKFEYVNNDIHEEYYKWQVCLKFKRLMDEALEVDRAHFTEALKKVKNCTENLIDSQIQPFGGLVFYSQYEPETVRKMFLDLYTENSYDPKKQMELIQDFLNKCNELREKYAPNSHLYKQSAHSVSAYLFLYDPEHHYLYKPTQSKSMADCIEFYDDWGVGEQIKLDIYYRMCDEILAEIKEYPALLKTNQSRYEIGFPGGELHVDPELHILLFDIIYCSYVYNLYDNITFSRLNTKEKQLIIEKRNKAIQYKNEYEIAKKEAERLDEALQYFVNEIGESSAVSHRRYGECEVLDVDEKYIMIKVISNGEEKKLGLAIAIANGLIWLESDEFKNKKKEFIRVLKEGDYIKHHLQQTLRQLEQYVDYLE